MNILGNGCGYQLEHRQNNGLLTCWKYVLTMSVLSSLRIRVSQCRIKCLS